MTITVDELLQLPSGATVINAGKHAGSREIRGAIRYRPSDLLETPHLGAEHEAATVNHLRDSLPDRRTQRRAGWGRGNLCECSRREAEQ